MRIHQGLISWNDNGLAKCGKFFPGHVRSGDDRLKFISETFATLEVDTSNYAIPTAATVRRWCAVTTHGFTLHVKAFALLTRHPVQMAQIPHAVRSAFPPALLQRQQVRYEDLGLANCDALWDYFNLSIEPVHTAGKLGCVLFQFAQGFSISEANIDILRQCRQSLDARYRIAIELRSRSWTTPVKLATTLALLRSLGATLVAVDELQHELYNQPLPAVPHVMPIELHVTSPDFFYARVHRRAGTQRLLSAVEIRDWADRLHALVASGNLSPEANVYIVWGTDHEDQSVANAERLAEALDDLAYNWRKHQKSRPGGLMSLFAKQAEKSPAKRRREDEAGVAAEAVVQRPLCDDVVVVEDDNENGRKSDKGKRPAATAASGSPVTVASPERKKQKVAGPSILSFFKKERDLK